jgi:hypothetical protein
MRRGCWLYLITCYNNKVQERKQRTPLYNHRAAEHALALQNQEVMAAALLLMMVNLAASVAGLRGKIQRKL